MIDYVVYKCRVCKKQVDVESVVCGPCCAGEKEGFKGPDFKKKYLDLLKEHRKAWGALPKATGIHSLSQEIASLRKRIERAEGQAEPKSHDYGDEYLGLLKETKDAWLALPNRSFNTLSQAIRDILFRLKKAEQALEAVPPQLPEPEAVHLLHPFPPHRFQCQPVINVQIHAEVDESKLAELIRGELKNLTKESPVV